MTNGLFTNGVGMLPLVVKQEVIANNLANVNTTGFKRDGAYFQRLLEAELFQEIDQGNSGALFDLEKLTTDFKQGALTSTGNQLDVALTCEGFFVVQTPQGEAYTRNGNFTINPAGQLVTNMGYPVMGEDGVIELENAGKIVISDQGEIFVDDVKTNKFLVKNFEPPELLRKIGHSLYVPADDNIAEIPLEQFNLKQGFLEQSNVNPIEEMVKMLITLRRFEALQRTTKFHNETLGKAVNELGRIK